MRFSHFLLPALLVAHQAQADVVNVPLLSDGTVDIEKVFQGFQFALPIHADGAQVNNFTGKILGEPFEGRLIDGVSPEEFSLAIDAPTLSEHASFLIAVLATELICLRRSRSPGAVLWDEAQSRNGGTWEVATSCSSLPR
ncbi:hypothetical protein [uncultured Mameliella sp.]|uniref:hypothetical protein n=1 Tax=uncultured Mameliella sp. TaxID=1447087 RepID=UPI0026299B6C|nr:hypothetical protein [uncultured Mameliella sp.]